VSARRSVHGARLAMATCLVGLVLVTPLAVEMLDCGVGPSFPSPMTRLGCIHIATPGDKLDSR
jgi:hypothetical protein